MTEIALAGLTVSGMYLLISLGFTMALRLGDIVNLAHGSFVVVGAYLAIAVGDRTGWGQILSGLSALVIGAVLATIAYYVVIRDGVRRGHRQQIVYTILLLGLIEAVLVMQFGPDLRSFGNPVVGWEILGSAIRRERVVAFVIAALLCVAVFAFLRWSPRGRLLEAVGHYGEAARAMGVNVERTGLVVYLLSSSMAVAAGVLIVGFMPVHPFLGLEMLTVAVIIAIAARLSFAWLPVTAVLYGLGVEVASNLTGSPTTATVAVLVLFLAIIALTPVVGSVLKIGRAERAV